METLILVDANDNEVGYGSKDNCHKRPLILHRAFSIFIFNDKDEMLIHKRGLKKKTWPSLWTNACCSHPRKDEETKDAAHRRLKEEMGFDCNLKFLFKFDYKAMYDKEWGEHEIDSVFIGKHNNPVKPDKNEIEEWKFVPVAELLKDTKSNPKKYTPWFKMSLSKVIEYYKKGEL
ncbi:MAG: isopentenyl-diphosphate Delta-isomerase [Candidatus Aenigmatarchaeota archaeon]